MEPIYLDHNATTPLRPEVREAMAPYLDDAFGNPSSLHRWGRTTAAALDDARARVARVLGARASEVHFVRGGTESDNLAVQGRALAARSEGREPRVAASAVEHSAVLEAMDAAVVGGGERHLVPVGRDGRLDPDAIRDVLALRPDVLSVMWVNNEVGTILPVPELAELAAGAGVPLHTDAVQAMGKVPVRVDRVPVSLLTLTGHKIYGPRGTAVLFVREGVRILPLVRGGGQERGLRPGTEDVAGAVGLAEALERIVEERADEAARLEALRNRLEAAILARFPDVRVHGAEGPRAPHVTNLGIPGVDATALVQALDMEGVAASSGSACHSGAHKVSHVLSALYGPDADVASVRFSLGKLTDDDAVTRASDVAIRVIERLRSLARAGAGTRG